MDLVNQNIGYENINRQWISQYKFEQRYVYQDFLCIKT